MSTNEIKVALRPSFRAWGVRIKTTIIAAAISVGSVGGVYADDTEVFFGQVDPTQNSQPNVMFVL